MHREWDRPVVRMTLWISLGIFLPSVPILLGILIAILQRKEVLFTDLLDGIELLLISLGLVTATIIDFSKAELDWSSRYLLFFFIRFALIILAIANLLLLTLIYVNNRVSDLSFDSDLRLVFAFIVVVIVGLFTLPLQFYIGYTRYKQTSEGTI